VGGPGYAAPLDEEDALLVAAPPDPLDDVPPLDEEDALLVDAVDELSLDLPPMPSVSTTNRPQPLLAMHTRRANPVDDRSMSRPVAGEGGDIHLRREESRSQPGSVVAVRADGIAGHGCFASVRA
jgi:hypothetical protein